jgi:hypothetical protein
MSTVEMTANDVVRMLKIVCLIVVSIMGASATSSRAFNRHITEDPTKTLHKYLSLDKKGARLEAGSWYVLESYVDWKEDLAWGQVVVISNFHIEDDVTQWEILNGLEAKIPVVFDVLGTMHWASVTFVPDSHQESYVFHIKAVYDRWQIVHPQLPPHVGQQRMLNFVRWTELNEPDATKKALFTSLYQQLKAR